MYALRELGLFSKEEVAGLTSDDIHAFLCRAFPDGVVTEAAVRKLLQSRGVKDVNGAYEAVQWLGIMEANHNNNQQQKGNKQQPASAIDALCKLLEAKLQYKKERKTW